MDETLLQKTAIDTAEVELYILPWLQVLLQNELQDETRFLPKEELERAAQFYRQADKHRFIAARLLLRLRLSQHSPSVEPKDWILKSGPHGKPYAHFPCDSLCHFSCHFNLAHSGDYIALAFSEKYPVGVDIEVERRVSDLLGIARMLYSKEDQQILADLLSANANAQREFFRLWTSYEALSKLEGTGLLARPQDSSPFFKRWGTQQHHHWALCWRTIPNSV